MSELIIDTLTGKTTANDITITVGASVTQSLEQGLAKAWHMSLDSGTLTVSDSLNISSVDDDGTGDYGQNYTSNFNSGDKSITAAGGYWSFNVEIDGVPASGSDEFKCKDIANSAAARDANVFCTTIHGDLA